MQMWELSDSSETNRKQRSTDFCPTSALLPVHLQTNFLHFAGTPRAPGRKAGLCGIAKPKVCPTPPHAPIPFRFFCV